MHKKELPEHLPMSHQQSQDEMNFKLTTAFETYFNYFEVLLWRETTTLKASKQNGSPEDAKNILKSYHYAANFQAPEKSLLGY